MTQRSPKVTCSGRYSDGMQHVYIYIYCNLNAKYLKNASYKNMCTWYILLLHVQDGKRSQRRLTMSAVNVNLTIFFLKFNHDHIKRWLVATSTLSLDGRDAYLVYNDMVWKVVSEIIRTPSTINAFFTIYWNASHVCIALYGSGQGQRFILQEWSKNKLQIPSNIVVNSYHISCQVACINEKLYVSRYDDWAQVFRSSRGEIQNNMAVRYNVYAFSNVRRSPHNSLIVVAMPIHIFFHIKKINNTRATTSWSEKVSAFATAINWPFFPHWQKCGALMSFLLLTREILNYIYMYILAVNTVVSIKPLIYANHHFEK